MAQDGYSKPVWTSEFGSLWANNNLIPYSSLTNSQALLNNLIRVSRPGNTHWYGGDVFGLYGWGSGYQVGLISLDGTKYPGYYAFRMGVRALQSCRPTYQTTSSSTSLLAITTKDTTGKVYLLISNTSSSAIAVDADLSALVSNGTGTLRQWDATHNDVVMGNPVLNAGVVSLTVPGSGAIEFEVGGGAPATSTPTSTPGGLTATPTSTSIPPTPTGTPSGGSNLVQNPGFESGTLTPWNCTGNCQVSTSFSHSGSYAVKLVSSSKDNTLTQVIGGLQPNTTYSLIGYGMLVKTGSSTNNITVSGYGGADVSSSIATTTYAPVTLTFTTGATNTTATISLFVGRGSIGVYFDDFVLQ